MSSSTSLGEKLTFNHKLKAYIPVSLCLRVPASIENEIALT